MKSPSQHPIHIGIIMDGNGRWAQLRGKPRTFGHIKGARVAKKIITHCAENGIEALTLFAFSTENWLRPQAEVNFLMSLLRRYLVRETENLVKQNIRFTTIGDIERLPGDLVGAIRNAIQRTSANTGLQLVFAVNYGSRAEITSAVRNLARTVQAGDLNADEIDESLISTHLDSYPVRDPDLIIRTSGESRLSNFMLWQAAYSEFLFSPTLWPDFSTEDLDLALLQFQRRERRFGRVGPDVRQLET